MATEMAIATETEGLAAAEHWLVTFDHIFIHPHVRGGREKEIKRVEREREQNAVYFLHQPYILKPPQ